MLTNKPELPGFEIHAVVASMFWGDWMIVAVRRSPMEEVNSDAKPPNGFELASDIFNVGFLADSKRRRFDEKETVYKFPIPIRLCIAPDLSQSNDIANYSIANLTDGTVYDSVPTIQNGNVNICARLDEVNLRESTSFGVVIAYSEPQETIGLRPPNTCDFDKRSSTGIARSDSCVQRQWLIEYRHIDAIDETAHARKPAKSNTRLTSSLPLIP